MFIWSVSFVWVKQTNLIDQMNQMTHKRTLLNVQASACRFYLQLITMASDSRCRDSAIERTLPDDTGNAD